jgi:hypothetical protein
MAPIDGNRNRPRINRPAPRPVAKPAAAPRPTTTTRAQPRQVRDSMDTTPRASTSGATASAASRGSIFNRLKGAVQNFQAKGDNFIRQQVRASGMGATGVAKAAGGALGGAFGIYTGVQQMREGARNGDTREVVGGALATGKGVANTLKGGLATAAALESRSAFKAVERAATAAIGDGSKLSKGIARAAAEAVHMGKDLTKVDVMGQAARSSGFMGKIGTTLKSAAAGVLGKVPFGLGAGTAAKLNNSIIKSGAQALGGTAKGVATALDAAGTATAAASAASKGVGTAGRMAARFTPGLNVAVAAMDVGIAIKTISDPNATMAAKVTSGVTALGSVMAATNIPGVAQAGALISLGSTAVGAAIENFDAIKEGVGKAASAVADGAKKVGSAIADGAKKIFSGW